MSVFAEKIWRPTIILRSGPEAREFGKPYKHIVVVEIPWVSWLARLVGIKGMPVEFKGMTDKIDWSEVRDAFRLIREMGYREDWTRMKGGKVLPGHYRDRMNRSGNDLSK